MATKDATVTQLDLLDVGEEINQRPLAETARRLQEMEPVLVSFIDAHANLIAGRLATSGVGIEHVRHVAMELRKLGYITMRAQSRGYYRLWKDAFEPEEPPTDAKTP
jgi:hypothetical protein